MILGILPCCLHPLILRSPSQHVFNSRSHLFLRAVRPTFQFQYFFDIMPSQSKSVPSSYNQEFFNASIRNFTGLLVARGPHGDHTVWASSIRQADPSTLVVVGGFRVLFNESSSGDKSATVDHILSLADCPALCDQYALVGLMAKQDFGPILLCECIGVRNDGRLIFRPVEWVLPHWSSLDP